MVCATGLTENDCVMSGAAANSTPPLVPPAWAAAIVQVPGRSRLTNPPLVTVQTLGVDDVNVTGNVDDAVAVSAKSATLYILSAIVAKVIVCFFLTTNVRVTSGAAA